MTANPRTHNDALVALLVAAGLVVGDATYPTDPYGWAGTPGQSVFTPYCIVYPLMQSFDGGLACSDSDSDFGWQVSCWGSTREQCDWIMDAVCSALIGAELVVAGRGVPRIRSDGGAGTRRDDTTQPGLFSATPRFAAYSS